MTNILFLFKVLCRRQSQSALTADNVGRAVCVLAKYQVNTATWQYCIWKHTAPTCQPQ